MLSIACLSMLSSTTATRCPRAEVMSNPSMNHSADFALFLPFSCNERRQLGTIRCKAEGLEVIEKMTKTTRHG
jgi:hypothetical protein